MSIKAMQDYVYYSKYARYNKKVRRRETWFEAIDRVKNMHLVKYAEQITKHPELLEEIEWAFEQSRQKRALGSQRALQFGGDPILKKNARIYNCVKENTPFITNHGVKTFADFSNGDKVIVLTHKGRWMPAVVKSYGEQALNRITIRRGKAIFKIDATAEHRWILKGGTETTSLQEGDRLAFGPDIFNDFIYEKSMPDERMYWAYGYTYGDGTKVKDENGVHRWSMVRLCGPEIKYLSRFEELGFCSSSSQSLEGDLMVYTGKYLKTLPKIEDLPRLIRAFVRGFLDADGEKNRNNDSPNPYLTIQATGEETIKFIRECFPVAGVYIVSEEDLTGQETNFGVRTEKTSRFRIINGFGHTAANFCVDQIEENIAKETVWCLEVEEDHSFVMPNGLPTGNCTVSFCDRIRFFQEAFWLLLCGCGTGFSVQRHHIAKLPEFSNKLPINKQGEWIVIKDSKATKRFLIPDSIEGWSDALGVLLASYMPHPEFSAYEGYYVEFDYSLIRPAGSSLSSGSGKAPGPEPLRRSIEIIRNLLNDCIAKGQSRLRPIDAYDIVMHASDAVLSGGVRRSATICLFSLDDEEMVKAKTGNWFIDNPQRGRSNNSALLVRGSTNKEDFLKLIESVKEFGEPGFVWADSTELVVNPCVEVGMWPVCEKTGESGWQMCNLCEQNGRKIKSREDWRIAARAAAIIGTLQAGYTDFDYLGPVTKRIVEREALLGCSITGMMDSPDVLFDPNLQCEMASYILEVNEELAPKLGINPCARGTCLKPAGCQSPDTMVVSDHGILMLGEIGKIEGDTWQNHNFSIFNGESNEISTKFFVNGLAKTKKIKLSSGVELEATNHHNFKVLRNGHLVWVRADEIIVGDLLPYILGGYKNQTPVSLNSLSHDKIHPNSLWDISPDFLNKDLCWLIGLYIGDGSNHSKGIRIHGDITKPEDLAKALRIIKEQFGINSTIEPDRRKGNRLTLVVNSVDLVRWLKINGLCKNKSPDIKIPVIIRMASSDLIKSFIDGYWCADGGLHKNKTRNWVTTSRIMSQQMVIVLRAIGQDCSMREMPPTESSKGKRMRYWIQEKKGRSGNYHKSPLREKYELLNKAGLFDHSPDVVLKIDDSECITVDIEVPKGNKYLANSYVSHNTTSCVLGTGSGIHPHHAKRYLRRIQGNMLEAPLAHFKKFNPQAIEKSVWSANGTDEVVSFCIEVPNGAKTKNDLDAITLLEYVKLTQSNWVMAGRSKERCTQPWLMNSVSNTINVRPDEWSGVADFIFDNRNFFTGVSLLPISGDKDYPQAPMTTIYTEKEIITIYGQGSLFASGLIVDGLHAFDNNLWKACDAALGLGEPLVKPADPDYDVDGPEAVTVHIGHYQWYAMACREWEMKMDWVRRAKQFAERYFDGDIRTMTYCLKDVNNLKTWIDLKRSYVDIDYTTMIEETDETSMMETIACAGGACELR